MPDFKSLKDLERYLLDIVTDSMEEVGQKAEQVVKKHIQSDVYDAYSPVHYDRTYELRESVQHKTNVRIRDRLVTTKINHDFRKIHSVSPNQHHSVVASYNPQNYSNFVPITVEEGTSGWIFGAGEWVMPRPYMRNSWTEISTNRSHITTLKEALRKRGLRSVDG